MAAANEAMARAAEAQRAGQWTVAEHHFREVLAAEPQRAEAHYHLAMVLAEQRRFDEALGSFDAAWQFRASVGAARADLQRALASNYVAVGMAFERASRLDRAAECFRKALELEPKDLAAAGNLGNALKNQGQLDAAADCYRRVLAIDPRCAQAHNDLGLIAGAQGAPTRPKAISARRWRSTNALPRRTRISVPCC